MTHKHFDLGIVGVELDTQAGNPGVEINFAQPDTADEKAKLTYRENVNQILALIEYRLDTQNIKARIDYPTDKSWLSFYITGDKAPLEPASSLELLNNISRTLRMLHDELEQAARPNSDKNELLTATIKHMFEEMDKHAAEVSIKSPLPEREVTPLAETLKTAIRPVLSQFQRNTESKFPLQGTTDAMANLLSNIPGSGREAQEVIIERILSDNVAPHFAPEKKKGLIDYLTGGLLEAVQPHMNPDGRSR